jgi:hypothetical protein
MVVYLYNEPQGSLMITSLDGRTTMVTRDNSAFDEILEMCKDPNADFDFISILLNENFWDYTSKDAKVSITKEDDDIYFFYGNHKEPLPPYLKKLISDRRNSQYLDTYKEYICNFLKRRDIGNKSAIDAYMSGNFLLLRDGFISVDFVSLNNIFAQKPELITSVYYDENNKERFEIEDDILKDETDYPQFIYTGFDYPINFVFNQTPKWADGISTKFIKFLSDLGLSEKDLPRFQKRLANSNYKELLVDFLNTECAIYDDRIIEEVCLNCDTLPKFYITLVETTSLLCNCYTY